MIDLDSDTLEDWDDEDNHHVAKVCDRFRGVGSVGGS